MLELSLHILDIAENAVRAEARNVTISIAEDISNDCVLLEICDDGKGMTTEELQRVLDPFFTTKTVRRIGLGLPMLAQAADNAGGVFEIRSKPHQGTAVRASFRLAHIDRQPLGDMAGTLTTLIAGNPGIRFIYKHRCNQNEYELDTDEIKAQLDDIPINHATVLNVIRNNITHGLKEISAQA